MKKIISLLLLTIFIINFVFSTFTVQISSSEDDKLIAIDVIWNDISFTYDVGALVWNPSNHSYESNGETAEWTDKSGKITAYNYSNIPILIDISFERAAIPNGTAILKISNPSFVLSESFGSNDCSHISADGVPENGDSFGKIVVSINVHTHAWNDGFCAGCGAILNSDIVLNGSDISVYKIVYSSSLRNGASDASQRLAAHIQSVLGTNIEIAVDGELNVGRAIIISDTLPDGMGDFELDTFTSVIQYVDGLIWISATNQYTLESAIDKFISDSTPKIYGETIELDYSGNNKVIVKSDTLGEPIKVMTYNLKNGSPSAERKANTIKDISDYMPDTIGTQETHLKWINALKGSLSDEYELVGEQRYGNGADVLEKNDNEASAILYRKNKFNLIDSGTYWLSETPEVVNSKLEESKYVRIMTYVVLERKSDGVRFVHVNTHLNTTPSINLRQVEIMVSLVNEKIYSKHGKLPTYYTGDFNADPTSANEDGYKYLISTGTENSRDIAEITSTENTIKGGGMIDHCVVTKGDFLVTFFDVGDDKGDADTSNHYPVYVEMYITNKSIIPLFSDDKSTSITMSPEASRLALYARDKIQLGIKELTGKELPEGENSQYEILIGDTGRAESIALKATLSADEYAIKTVGKKIVIVASNEAFLYEAAKYFCDNYLKSPYVSADEGKVTLFAKDIDVRRAGDKTSVHYNVALGTHLNAYATATYTLNNQKYGVTDANPRIYRRQGGCFDGEIYYQVFITKQEELAVVGRQNVVTGELIYSEPRLMDHANDATYNPYTDRLYVGNSKTVWIYDGTTLEFIESKTLSHATSRISYSPERHTYVLGSYYLYNDSLTYTGKYFKSQLSTLYGDKTLSSQGTACDDTFIYSLLIESLGSSKYNAYIGVLDWYGNTLALVNVEFPDKIEPENISIVDGKIYVAACSTQPVATVYEITFD